LHSSEGEDTPKWKNFAYGSEYLGYASAHDSIVWRIFLEGMVADELQTLVEKI